MTGKCWNISTNQQTQKPRFVGGVLLAQPLQFCSVPPLFGGLQGGNLSYQEEKDFFMVKIQDILQKQAASLVPLHSREKGFYSKLVSAGLFSGVSDMYSGNVFHALSAHKFYLLDMLAPSWRLCSRHTGLVKVVAGCVDVSFLCT